MVNSLRRLCQPLSEACTVRDVDKKRRMVAVNADFMYEVERSQSKGHGARFGTVRGNGSDQSEQMDDGGSQQAPVLGRLRPPQPQSFGIRQWR